MTNSIYAALSRQTGLMKEMQVVANNIANSSTTGFRKEGLVFSEHIHRLSGAEGSLSQPSAVGRITYASQGALRPTGGAFDLAIEGPGYFLISTPQGERLTRAGAFAPAADGTLTTQDGHQVLDAGRAPVFVPSELGEIEIAKDGTVSAGGEPIGQIGVFQPTDPLQMRREAGVRFASEAGIDPVFNANVVQGFVEGSNVDPVTEIARMIEVQRAYEFGQSFLEQEDKRIGSVISTVGRS